MHSLFKHCIERPQYLVIWDMQDLIWCDTNILENMNTKIVYYLTLDLLLFGKYTEYEVFLHTSHLWKHKDNNKYVTKYINYLGYDKFILTSLKKTIKASNPPARPRQGLLPSNVSTSRSQIRFNGDQVRRSSQSILGSSFECCPS